MRKLHAEKSTSDMLDIVSNHTKKGPTLLSKRRELKKAMVKFSSCSTLIIDGLPHKLDYKSTISAYK